jgi:hypothetical protein
MDPPELASEPPRSRIKLRAAFKSIGWGNVRVSNTHGPRQLRHTINEWCYEWVGGLGAPVFIEERPRERYIITRDRPFECNLSHS